MIYIVYSSQRPGDYYFFHLSTNTWSGWASSSDFKPLPKFPYSDSTNTSLKNETDLVDITAKSSLVSHFTPLGTSINEVRDNYPEYFL